MGRRRISAGFTLLELVVAIGLMVMLMSVLAFVFRQSAEAVGAASEAVAVVQRARVLGTRLGKELGAAVEYYVPNPTNNREIILAFEISADGKSIEFVSQTLQEGVLDTWNIKYYYLEDPGNKGYGAIYRRVREKDKYGLPPGKNDVDEVVAWPVRNVRFKALGNDPKLTGRLPGAVELKVTFLDSWDRANCGRKFTLPQVFYLPIYQGH